MLESNQKNQIAAQIEAYERKGGVSTLTILLGNDTFELEVDNFVASPEIMNLGLEIVSYLVQHPELVRDKVVVDMGTGSGVIGLAAAKLGAQRVVMADIDHRAVANAQRNVRRLNLSHLCDVRESDLFSEFDRELQADVQIFNHPFFADEPIDGKKWTRMMLGGTELIGRYFEQASKYSKASAVYLMPWLTLAGNEDGRPDNDPSKRALEYGYKVTKASEGLPSSQGLQRGTFKIYLLRKG